VVLRLHRRSLSIPHALPCVSGFVYLLLSSGSLCQATNTISLSTNSLTVSGSNPNYSVNVGTIDGLGLGTSASNVSVTPISGVGQLWWFNIKVTLGFTTNGSGTLAAQVTTNYSHSTVQTAYVCHGGACDTVTPTALTTSSYTTFNTGLSSTSGTLNLGTLITPGNGAGAFTGADSVTLTLQAASTGSPATCNLTINLSAQNAVQFTLATSGAGLTISPSTDFSAAWGTVNGLGVGTPTSGLTTYSVAGGAVYETPISLLPVYSSFSSTTCTLSVYVSSNFTHSSVFILKDTGTSGGPYTTISLSSASPTSMTTTAASSSTVTRYLGVLVSNLDGASSYSGADNATLTYQMTVP